MKRWMIVLFVALVAGNLWAATPTQEEQDRMFMEAVLLNQQGSYKEAEVRLKNLAKWQPNDPTIKRLLQEVQEKLRAQKTDPVKALKLQLEELIVPEVNFRDAVVGDVIEFLRDQSAQLSPDKSGVNIVWEAPEEAKTKKLTLRLRQVPLGEVVRYAVQAAGLKYRVEPYAVVIYAPGRLPPRDLMKQSLNEQLGADLNRIRADGLYRTLREVASAQGPHITLDGREFLNFSSNDYLGLANDLILKRAAADAVERFGVGAGASRYVCGNLSPYTELEAKLARFKNREATLVFGSGYAANVGTITALVGEGDVVILDKLDHASIIDGARQSGATIRVYPHKNLKKLEGLLQSTTGRVLIITETVFSMDGDLAPLKEIVELKDKYGAWLMIDEAHATGLYGHQRRGLAEPLGLENKIDITVGTLSKALGCAGGFVVGSQTLIDYLRNRARSLIYSTALPPAVVAAAGAAVDFVMSDAGGERRDQLWRAVSELKQGLSALGIQNESRSPIIPVIIGEEQAAVERSQRLYEQGIFVPAIRYPTVPKGKARLRVTVTASHSTEDIQRFLHAFAG